MTEQQRHNGAEHVVEGSIPHPPTAGAPALERDPEAEVRQFARAGARRSARLRTRTAEGGGSAQAQTAAVGVSGSAPGRPGMAALGGSTGCPQ